MNSTPAYIIQGDNITIVIDSKLYTISKTHLTYNKIIDAIKTEMWDQVKQLVNPVKMLANYSRGNLSVVDGELLWKGKHFHNALSARIIKMLEEGFNVEPMVKFMHNLLENPSKKAVDELYGFLEKNSLPITSDGHFLAYKKVRSDYKDVYSGTMDNSVGKVVEMDRNSVDDNRDNTCSTGLHFCSHSYLAHFSGERTVIVKINPRDVVSIPSDYNNAKGRTCRYEVIGEVPLSPNEQDLFDKPVQDNANSAKINKPKTGSTIFYQGYTDGYTRKAPLIGPQSTIDYVEGYRKGEVDQIQNNNPRYQFVNPSVIPNKW